MDGCQTSFKWQKYTLVKMARSNKYKGSLPPEFINDVYFFCQQAVLFPLKSFIASKRYLKT